MRHHPAGRDRGRRGTGLRRVDIAIGLFIILFGAFGVSQSVQLDMVDRNGRPGPGLYPLMLSVILVGLGVLLVIHRLRGEPAAFGRFSAPTGFELGRVAQVVLALGVSIVLLPIAGYFLSTVALVAALLFGVERLTHWRAVVTTLALPAIFFVVFVVLLRVRLPGGFIDL